MVDENIVVTPLDALTNLYYSYEGSISVRHHPADGVLKSLVTFDTSKSAPIHRWYVFKEGYSHLLLEELRNREILPNNTQVKLLDPFCGVATTLLSHQLSSRYECGNIAFGIERNPAVRFIAQAKLNWQKYRVEQIESLIKRLRKASNRHKRKYPIPELSTLTVTRKNGKKAFEQTVLQELLYLKQWISEQCEGEPEYDFLMLAWTSIIERTSNTRKDGRALRLLENTVTPNVKDLLVTQCELMLEDLQSDALINMPAATPSCVIAGDGRRLPFASDTFTAICYSPPYLNNIDYSEVYKLELWLRGDVTTKEQFYNLRLNTLRSHPSIMFPATTICQELHHKTWIRRLKAALLASLPNDNFLRMRQSLFSGYIDDLLLTLREQFRVAAPGTPIVCIVGNSLHGGKNNHTVPVCTDLLIAAAAQAVGLQIDHLQIARQLPRRDSQNGWLRETIIVMRKPKSSSKH